MCVCVSVCVCVCVCELVRKFACITSLQIFESISFSVEAVFTSGIPPLFFLVLYR